MTHISKARALELSRRGFLGASATGAAMFSGLFGATPANAQTAQIQAATPADIAGLPRVRQEMVAPPFLPVHDQVAKGGPKVIEVEFLIDERKVDVDYNATIWAFTYNGSVPGPMIVVHEGDFVELTLINPATSMLEHNIDFHASTGAMGGGELTLVRPGQKAVLRWQATKAGVFVYHCAPGGDMIPYHVCHGMNGAVMVLPRDGLKDGDGTPLTYDRAYYVGEQDYYLPKDENGDYREYDNAMGDFSDALDAMRGLIPSHVVFNGSVGALTGENAMKASVGEKVLIIHAQANRDTRPHLIGGHGDYVWETGSFADAPMHGLETWFIRGGSAGAALYEFRQPGLYAYVNHNLIEAIMLGGAAHYQDEGTWNDTLMQQVMAPTDI